ncbi:MAG: SDR family oxidoreductase [Caldilineaceae bacterium]|nr:SDR family oxidoreductase [Caldilineaceae bacterium]
MSLKDKVVLVTGSTTGIGEATARLAVEQGARVMVHGLEADLAQAVCRDLGDAADYLLADLLDPANCAKLVQATVARFGRLDGLVNNAAVTTRSNLESTDAELFDRIIGINLRAPLLLIRAAVSVFRAQAAQGQPGGTIVNIGSINALSGEPNLLAYSASKGGLMTATQNLANALATEKIRVNQLNLGWVTSQNEIALKIREGLPVGWENNVPALYAPTGRLLTPAQVAHHVLFWLSDASAPANGVVYVLEQYAPIGRNPHKAF